MKILAISDLHGNLPEIEDCDLLLVAGDIAPDFGGDPVVSQRTWIHAEFTDWMDDLHQRDIHVMWIGGNHDFYLNFAARKMFEGSVIPGIYMEDNEDTFYYDNGRSVGEIKVFGTPWVPNLPSWAFHLNAEALSRRAQAIPEGLDILMTHGPPHGVGDVVGGKYGSRAGMHVGDNPMLKRLKEMDRPPKLVVCGHIHEAAGYYRATPWGRPLVNVSMVNDLYDVQRGATDITEMVCDS